MTHDARVCCRLQAAASGKGTYGLFEWDAQARTRLHLVDLRTGAVRIHKSML